MVKKLKAFLCLDPYQCNEEKCAHFGNAIVYRCLSNFFVKSKEIHSEWKKGKISVKKKKGTFRASIENTGGGKKNTIIIISLLQ